MTCSEIRHLLGAYVVGAIDSGEGAYVEAHLAGCAACRDELAGLAGLPALLARVPSEEFEEESGSALSDAESDAESDADPPLLDRLLARVAAHRRKFRRLAAAAVVAAIVAAGGSAAGAYLAGDDSGAAPSGRTTTVSATNPGAEVWGRVTVSKRAWGASLSVRLSGVPRYTTCRLVAVGEGGTRSVAGSWRVTYQGDVSVVGATALYPAEIVEFEVVTGKGRRLLTIPGGTSG